MDKSNPPAHRFSFGTELHVQAARYFCRPVLMIAIFLTLFVSIGSPAIDPTEETHAELGLRLAQEGNLAGAESELQQAVALAPANPEILASLGTVLALEKKFEESTTVLKKALKLSPHNMTVRRYLAANLWQLQRYSESKENLEIILTEKPGDEAARLLLGMVAENMKDYARAARMLSSVPRQVRQQPESVVALARSYYHLGQTEKARAALAELSERRTDTQGIFLGAEIADEMHDYETAEKLLISIHSAFPDQAALGYRLALVQYHAERFADSQRNLLNLMAAEHATAPTYNLLGWCYYKQGQYQQAAQALEQAINLAPEEEGNYLDLGKILVANRSLPSALSLARKATSALPNSARVFELQGLVETRMGQFTDAIISYSRAVHLDPSGADAILGLAQAQYSAGMAKQAASSFETAIKRFPREARPKVLYASVLLKQAEMGDPQTEHRAVMMLQAALSLNHSLPSAHYELGNLALNKGRLTEALEHLEEAVKLDARSSEAHFALARAYRRAGRKQEADRELSLYQKLKETEAQVTLPPLNPGMQK